MTALRSKSVAFFLTGALLFLVQAPALAEQVDLSADIEQLQIDQRKARRQGHLFVGGGLLVGSAGFMAAHMGASSASEYVQLNLIGVGALGGGVTFGVLRYSKARRLKREREELEASLESVPASMD